MDGMGDIYFIVDNLLYVVYLATDAFHCIISRTLDSLGPSRSDSALRDEPKPRQIRRSTDWQGSHACACNVLLPAPLLATIRSMGSSEDGGRMDCIEKRDIGHVGRLGWPRWEAQPIGGAGRRFV